MLMSSLFDFISPSSNSSSKGWRLQGQSIGDAIKQTAKDAAAKRKALAAERLKMLAERLRVLMLLSSADRKGIKGNIEAAAGIAKEIAATVKDYAGASADIAAQAATSSDSSATSTTSSTTSSSVAAAATTSTQGVSTEDEAFLNTAVQLSSQVKSFIAQEIQKAKQKHLNPDTHQSEINVMDNSILDAAKSMGISDASTTVYPKPFSATLISVIT
jgi:cell division septation protein DedD